MGYGDFCPDPAQVLLWDHQIKALRLSLSNLWLLEATAMRYRIIES